MTARKYDPICSYPECGRKHNARGLCGPHGAMQHAGKPLRPLQDRTGPIAKSALERFSGLTVHQDNGCTVWVGGRTLGGYGTFAAHTRHGAETSVLAHRWAYEHHVGPIPEGFDIDHLCRNRPCVNPDHLEAVTRAENIRRAFDRTHCSSGHLLDGANTYTKPGTAQRRCKTCAHQREVARAPQRNAAKRAARLARGHKKRGPQPKSHCLRGHELAGENLYIAPKSGIRSCRECRRLAAQRRAA